MREESKGTTKMGICTALSLARRQLEQTSKNRINGIFIRYTVNQLSSNLECRDTDKMRTPACFPATSMKIKNSVKTWVNRIFISR